MTEEPPSGTINAVPNQVLKPYQQGDTLPKGVHASTRINGSVYIAGHVIIDKDVTLGHNTELWGGEEERAALRIGRGTHINSQCIIHANGFPVTIGQNVTLDPQVTVNCIRQKGLPYRGPVEIGDRSQISANAALCNNIRIGNDVFVGRNTTIYYWTNIGEGTQLYDCAVGVHPQDHTWQAELTRTLDELRNNPAATGERTVTPTYTRIGKHCVIREGCRVSRGTCKTEKKMTTIEDFADIQDHTHIAHDCHLMHHVHIGSGSKLAGHAVLHPYAALAGAVKVDRFIQIGMLAYAVANIGIARDVPPFAIADYKKGTVRDLRFAVNRKGLDIYFKEKRPDHSAEDAYRSVLRRLIEGTRGKRHHGLDAMTLDTALRENPDSRFVKAYVDFMKESIDRATKRRPNL